MTTILPFAIEDADPISAHFSQSIQQLLLEFAQNHACLGELLVSTADGYEVAAVLKEQDPGRLHKIAAMTSSLLGIGAAMLYEIDAGSQKAITIEGENDNILLWQIATPDWDLCLTAVASTQEPLGQLFWLLRQLAARIAGLSVRPELPLTEANDDE